MIYLINYVLWFVWLAFTSDSNGDASIPRGCSRRLQIDSSRPTSTEERRRSEVFSERRTAAKSARWWQEIGAVLWIILQSLELFRQLRWRFFQGSGGPLLMNNHFQILRAFRSSKHSKTFANLFKHMIRTNY